MRRSIPFLLAGLAAVGPSPGSAGGEAPLAELPPALPWDGASRSLALSPDSEDPWITPSERTGLTATPTYEETEAWLARLVEASPLLRRTSLGKSAEGRDIWLIVASADGSFTPQALRNSKKPRVFMQAGIHSGEIDGKDAGLMLLRDLTVKGTKRHLLDGVQFLFVPIFNVDGHERRSSFGRVNQRGPEQMGWRTTARNLNLNRDYAKAETPEMRAMIRALGDYEPDLYVDLHVTDGIDYQYDITWGYMGDHGYSPSIARWLESVLDPAVQGKLEARGHVPGYLVFATDPDDPDASLFKWSSSSPRYSDGYGGARRLPTVLVENHSLKPYPQRVLGTYLLMESMLETAGKEAQSLRAAIRRDRSRRPADLPLGFRVDPEKTPEEIPFKGVTWERRASEAAGTEIVQWLGEPVIRRLPRIEAKQPTDVVALPRAWWIPAPWSEVIERLRVHGIRMEVLDVPREVEVDQYRVHGAELAASAFEGRSRVSLADEPAVERRRVTFPAGSARVPVDQPLGVLAALLLEPRSADSFFQWGFFNEILSRTEYVEAYVMGPLGDRMLKADPRLAECFRRALQDDPEMAADPGRRLAWLYRQTPYHDERYLLYPVAREPAGRPSPR